MKTKTRSDRVPALLARVSCIFSIVLLAVAGTTAGAADKPKPEQPFKPDVPSNEAVAIFAGGCFWCMEAAYDPVKGVVSTISGYTGGHVNNPTYHDVTSETSGHAESLKVVYKPDQVSYDKLLDVFWHNVDPTDDGGQFCDRGDSYRSEIFAVNNAQMNAAKKSKKTLEKDKSAPKPILTKIVPAVTFYPAEDYHQNYYNKNPIRYKFYRSACRRDATLAKVWGDKAGGHQ